VQVLGLDISQKSTGWAVLSDGLAGLTPSSPTASIQVVDHGYLDFDKNKPLSQNLFLFHSFVKGIIVSHPPIDVICIEDTFFGKNPKTAKLLDRYGATAILAGRMACTSAKMMLLAVASHRAALSDEVKKFLGSKGLKMKGRTVDKDEVYLYICNKYGLRNVRNDETDAISVGSYAFLRKEDPSWVI